MVGNRRGGRFPAAACHKAGAKGNIMVDENLEGRDREMEVILRTLVSLVELAHWILN